MGRYNNGIVYTNENCIGCNKCVYVCQSFGANVSVGKDAKAHVEVSNNCINCGMCVRECHHNARMYRDDTEDFFEALAGGERISLVVDPSFPVFYGEDAYRILQYLRAKGVNKMYDVSYGAEISAWCHAKYIKDSRNNPDPPFIANNCVGVTNYVERFFPKFIKWTIPVYSPVDCTVIYARKYLNDDAKIAYLGSCVSELVSAKERHGISYCVMIDSLVDKIGSAYKAYAPTTMDLYSDGIGRMLPFSGGFCEMVSLYFPRGKSFIHYDGLNEDLMNKIKRMVKGENRRKPTVFSAEFCIDSCLAGPGLKKSMPRMKDYCNIYNEVRMKAFEKYDESMSPHEFFRYYGTCYKDLDFNDFLCTFRDEFVQPFSIPEEVIEDIFTAMHKTVPEKKHMDCGSCGYKSCRQMAAAVANGYSKIQNCIHFMNDDLVMKSFIDRQLGILNAAGFTKKLEETVRQHPYNKYIVCMGNINSLGIINDLYTKRVGDEVLFSVARSLTDFVGEEGGAARFGGGVFGVFFEYTAEKLDDFMSRKNFDCRHVGVGEPVTMRFGMAVHNDSEAPVEVTVNRASHSSGKTIDKTRNTYNMFTTEMLNELTVESRVTSEMQEAMKNGEFKIYLQPQHNIKTGEIVGAEALCRWIKKDGTLISPGVFIPVFEKNGFIRPLDKHIWEEAFLLVSEWEKNGVKGVPVSLNISRKSLIDDEFISVIASLQSKYNINKNMIHFEITESAYIDNADEIADRITRLKELGFKIAMDDFGSGYSSLNSLKDIPLDILKLDMGFFRKSENEERGRKIIGLIVEMAKELQLVTVAEGVEKPDQAKFLDRMGCDIIQGYLYSRPMPVKDFEALL